MLKKLSLTVLSIVFSFGIANAQALYPHWLYASPGNPTNYQQPQTIFNDVWDPTNHWLRTDIGGNSPTAEALADNTANPTVSGIAAFNMIFDGTTWDRMPGTSAAGVTVNTEFPAAALLANATALPTTTGGYAVPMVYNGSTLDIQQSADRSTFFPAATLTARNSIGASVHEKGSRWSVISNPAAGSQATASISGEANVQHVADCISFSAASTTAPALTALTVNLRDGATGAGTVIWTFQVVISNATGQNVNPHTFCGLNLMGSTATAMTLEFSASLANLIQSVSLSGFNVN